MSSPEEDSFEAFVRSKRACDAPAAETLVVPRVVVANAPAADPLVAPRADASATDSDTYDSPFLLSDAAILARGVKASHVELYRRAAYQRAFSVSTFYHLLRDATFRTAFVPLNFAEARALCNAHLRKEATETDSALVAQLEARLAQELACFAAKSVFVKLDTRSPKDVPIYDFENAKLKALLDARLDAIDRHGLSELQQQNLETAAFVVASTEVLCITQASEAMDLLVRSQRVYEGGRQGKQSLPPISDSLRLSDLSKQLQFDEHLFEACICLREVDLDVIRHPEREFRCASVRLFLIHPLTRVLQVLRALESAQCGHSGPKITPPPPLPLGCA